MQTTLTDNYQDKVKEVSARLGKIPSDESSFIKLETLFFDALLLARTSTTGTHRNSTLTALKNIQENEYRQTQVKYSKSRQREVVIKQFRTAFKKEMSLWMKSCREVMN